MVVLASTVACPYLILLYYASVKNDFPACWLNRDTIEMTEDAWIYPSLSKFHMAKLKRNVLTRT